MNNARPLIAVAVFAVSTAVGTGACVNNGAENNKLGGEIDCADRAVGEALDSASRCLEFWPAGVYRLGIRNTCSQCRVAVYSWLNGSTGEWTEARYRVSGNREITVTSGGISGRFIREEPCD